MNFFAKILNSFKLLTILAKRDPSQMFEWVENRLPAKGLNIDLTFVPNLQIKPKNTKPENGARPCWEVNRTIVYAEAAVRRVL